MPRFRKLPVEIDAELCSDLMDLAKDDWYRLPPWVRKNYECGNILFLPNGLSIETKEGQMHANPDDYLLQGVAGEVYPCKPDIFSQTHEAV